MIEENEKQEDECPQICLGSGCQIFIACGVKKEERTAEWWNCPAVKKEIKHLMEELKFKITKWFGIFEEDWSKLDYLDARLQSYVEKLVVANEEAFKKMNYKRR